MKPPAAPTSAKVASGPQDAPVAVEDAKPERNGLMIEFARLHIMMPAGLCAVLLAAACLAADKPSDAETLRTMVEAD